MFQQALARCEAGDTGGIIVAKPDELQFLVELSTGSRRGSGPAHAAG